MLPSKRKRAIVVAKLLVERQLKNVGKDYFRKNLLQKVAEMFEPKIVEEEYNIDYYSFSQKWLDILMPLLSAKRHAQKRKDKKVFSLLDLKSDRSIYFSNELLQEVLDSAPLIVNIWNRVASCIIGIPKDN